MAACAAMPTVWDEKLVTEGRKVSLANAAENPTAKDIYTVCSQFLGLNCKLENVFMIIYKYITYNNRKVIRKIG